MKAIRIVVADGAAVLRAAVRSVLDREKDFDVVEAADLESLHRAVDEGLPDVALVDLALPPDGGIEAVRELARRGCSEIIVWSFRRDRAMVFNALRAGASGYLHKEISPEGLVRALRGAARGEAPLTRELMALVIDAIHALDDTRHARERTAGLSEREREVLSHLAGGERNKQIASELAISEFTVKRHVQNILRKLELPSRRAAAAFYDAALSVERPA